MNEKSDEEKREIIKYAYVVNAKGVDPKEYSQVYKNDECYFIAIGVDGDEDAVKIVRNLMKKEFTVIDVCSEFSNDALEKMNEIAGETASVKRCRYERGETLKRGYARSYRHQGTIIALAGLDKPVEIVLRHPNRDTRIILCSNMRHVRKAAERLTEKRVNYIELGRWFDGLRIMTVRKHMDKKIAVGTCGDVTLQEPSFDWPPDEIEPRMAEHVKISLQNRQREKSQSRQNRR